MELYAINKEFAASYLEIVENATAEERAQAFDRFGNETLPSILARSDNGTEATITISGVLTPNGPSFIDRFFGFGGTAYKDIVAAANNLENDPTIENVRLIMDTPGGLTSGMDAARQALESLASKKTIVAENHGRIASAGYYLASTASRIVAMSPMALTGSIGVVVAGVDFTEAMERRGIKKIRIVSANAPDKQPDPTTKAGKNVIQEGVNAMERIFINAIAKDRNVTDQFVIDNFGSGAELVAFDPDSTKPDALSAGMIDSVVGKDSEAIADDSAEDTEIAAQVDNTINPMLTSSDKDADQGGKFNLQESKTMDITTLKSEHPALYASVIELGVKQERDRVDAHLTMGDASGDMEYAVACIKDGSELTATVNSKYMAASMNKKAVEDRADETDGDIDTGNSNDVETADKELAVAASEVLGVQYNG